MDLTPNFAVIDGISLPYCLLGYVLGQLVMAYLIPWIEDEIHYREWHKEYYGAYFGGKYKLDPDNISTDQKED